MKAHLSLRKDIVSKEKDELKNFFESTSNYINENPEKYVEFLTNNKFKNYSLKNQSLIYAQTKGMATVVQSFKNWKELNINVNKGEKAISIFIPTKTKGYYNSNNKYIPLSNATEEDYELINSGRLKIIESVNFKLKACVFDAKQTNITNEKLLDLSNERNIDLNQDKIFTTLKKYCFEKNIKINPTNIAPDHIGQAAKLHNGSYEIWIDINLSQKDKNRVLLHEIAHIMLGHNERDNKIDSDTCEIQAESFAFFACKDLNIDSEHVSKAYISNYFKDKDFNTLCNDFDKVFKLRSEVHNFIVSNTNNLDKKAINNKKITEATSFKNENSNVVQKNWKATLK